MRGPVPFDVAALPVETALGDDPPPWFVEWLAHPHDDDYWAARRPDLPAIEVPVFTVLGYFDDFSSGTARLIEATGAEAVCGPWVHMPWGTAHDGVELGAGRRPSRRCSSALVPFFERVFGRVRGDPAGERVTYHCVGAGWRPAGTWPPPHAVVRWTATSGGNANSRHGDGRARARRSAEAGTPDVLVVEPLVPYPGEPVGFQDEAAVRGPPRRALLHLGAVGGGARHRRQPGGRP